MQWAGANPYPDSQAIATAANAGLGQWWQHFNDPLLTTLVVDAMRANTTVQGAQASLMQARALKQVSEATLFPALGSSIVAQRNGNHDTTVNNVRVALDASWEVDIFGTNRSGVRVSDATEKATAASLADTQVSVSAEVALNYINLRSTQMRLALARSSLASQQETLDITRWRQQVGLVTVLDTAQASAALEQTRSQIPLLEITLVQTSHALAVLTGHPPASLLATLATPGAVPQTVGEPALSFPANTLRQRPDVRAAEFQVLAALARVDQAQAARLPNFKISGSLGLSAVSLAALADGTALTTGLLASVALPLFDGGASKAQVQVQEAALEQTRSNYKSVVLLALKDVEDTLTALRGDRARLLSLQAASESATTAAQLANLRYRSGLVDFQTVLETQRTQLGTQDGVATAIASVSADHVRLYMALGGGWHPNVPDGTGIPKI